MCGVTPKNEKEIREHLRCIAVFPATQAPDEDEGTLVLPVYAIELPDLPEEGRSFEVTLPEFTPADIATADPPFKVPI